MTPKEETPQLQHDSDGRSLFAELKKTPARKLVNSIENVDGLSPEEEDAHERGGRLALRGEHRNLIRRLLRASYWAVIILSLVIGLALISLLTIYIIQIYREGKIEGIISSILSFIFGSVATIAVDRFITKDK